MLNDPTYWDHPEEFRPQRFLDANGRFCQNNASIPFGLGQSPYTNHSHYKICIKYSVRTGNSS